MQTQGCRKLKEHLVGLVEGSLSPDLREEIQDHLSDCPRCTSLVTEFSALWGELGTCARREPPESFWPALEESLQTLEQHPFRSGTLFTGALGLLRPAAVGLALLFAALAGFQLGNPQGKFAPAPQLSKISSVPEQAAYAAFYLEPFTDIPEGSLADFYLGAEPSDEEDTP